MECVIHMLYLEDDPADVALVQAELAEAGLKYSVTQAQTRDGFETALCNEDPDIILSDFRLPAYDGMSALRLAKQLRPDIPFIFVSGTMGEEAAIEVLTQGATDYVLKQNLTRLPSAVQRALQEARERRDRKQAEQQVALMNFALNSIHEAAFLVDEKACFQYVNEEACRLLGYTRDELLTMRVPDISPELSMQRWPDRWKDLKQHGTLTFERELKTSGGRTFPVEISASYLEYEGQSYNLGLVRDITERKQAESRLNEQLHFFQQLLDSIPIPVFYKDREGLYLGCNAAFEVYADLPRKDIVGRAVHEVAPKAFADKHHEADLALLRHPGMQTYEINGVYKDGKSHDVIFHKATFVDINGDVAGTVGALMDVTELKQAEHERLANLRFIESLDRGSQAIQKADSLEQMMKDVLDIVLSKLDCDRVYLMHPCDPAAANWTVPMERSKPGYAGSIHTQNLAIPMEPTLAKMLQILIDAGGPVTFGPGADHPLTVNAKDRFGIRSMLAMALFPRVGKAWQLGVHRCSHAGSWTAEDKTLIREIGRRLEDALSSLLAYRDLQESEERYRLIAENTADTISVFDLDLNPIYISPSVQKQRGYTAEEAMAQSLDQVLTLESLQKAKQIFAEQLALEESGEVDPARTVLIELEQYRKDGSHIWVELAASALRDDEHQVIGVLTVSRDITERKKLEEQLRQSQKMEAVGQLAGGVAHDFNNMLGVIIGSAELAMGACTQDKALQKHLESILAAGHRSAEITRQLLAFARKQAIMPKVLDLNEIVEGMLKLLRRLIGEDIDLVWQPGAKLWPVKMDPSQVDQIMANLCVNARDAIAGVGKVTIETRNVVLDDAYCAEHKGSSPGEYVVLAVSDNGSGMDKQTMDKIFEPFFTTKGLGQGTGLGLSTVYGIVKQNGGYINVYSQPEKGTTFQIYLTRHAVEAESKAKEGLGPPTARGHETILVVEDDSIFLDMVKQMLKSLGYAVFTASTPGEAIRIASDNPGLDLLIADVIMPEMKGQALANELSALNPQLRCLFMSGYPGNVIADRGIMDERVNFIQKPFSIPVLGAKVREVLDND
jgi:PAS domain S-box-containing protein